MHPNLMRIILRALPFLLKYSIQFTVDLGDDLRACEPQSYRLFCFLLGAFTD